MGGDHVLGTIAPSGKEREGILHNISQPARKRSRALPNGTLLV